MKIDTLKRWLIAGVLGSAYSFLLRVIAYGPWGPLHRFFIFCFRRIYSINWQAPTPEDARLSQQSLGEFFLRPISLSLDSAPLVSPVEGRALEGPLEIKTSEPVSVKGIVYEWKNFREITAAHFANGLYWNLYLAPPNYHWVHAPAAGKNLRALHTPGCLWPVNAWGRSLSPRLYAENERLTFSYESDEYGQVVLICVAAMGVSGLRSAKGPVSKTAWTPLGSRVNQGEKLLGFELGSTVLLLVEKAPPPSSRLQKDMLRVGSELLHSA